MNKIGEDEGEEGYLILAELTSSHESANRNNIHFLTLISLTLYLILNMSYLNIFHFDYSLIFAQT